jgi:Cu(I)/Ag(I) efflux system membrane fusion protein
MSRLAMSRPQIFGAAAVLLLLGAGAGYGLSKLNPAATPPPAKSDRKVLYWYDPMVPAQHFDRPGKSPFMDMQLVPRYADEGRADAGVSVDPARVQALGIRLARVEQGSLQNEISVPGVLDFNGRDVAVAQARAGGFVQSAPPRAPGDVIPAGAALATVLVPEWAGAQTEFLAVRRTGDARLIQAARQRLALLGMSPGAIAAVERTGRPQSVVTVTAPVGGVIRTLSVRPGMTVSQGQTLAEINGLSTVWLNAAVPEALAGRLRPGQAVQVTLAAFPEERFPGRVSAILPEAASESRTLTARIELPNRDGRLRPGMFGQAVLQGGGTAALLVPSEAVIRTGRRTLVMLALPGGRYRPAEVQVGRESGGRTEILAGLRAGEQVVASGQFLLDSEASLAGIQARPATSNTPAGRATQPTQYETTGRIERLDARSVTFSHEPVPALQWPAMTMTFALPDPALAKGLKVGDRVRFAFDQAGGAPTVRRLEKAPAQ